MNSYLHERKRYTTVLSQNKHTHFNQIKVYAPPHPLRENADNETYMCVRTERNGYIPVHAQSHTVTLTVAETSNSRST